MASSKATAVTRTLFILGGGDKTTKFLGSMAPFCRGSRHSCPAGWDAGRSSIPCSDDYASNLDFVPWS